MQPLLLYSGDQYAGSSNESYFSKVLALTIPYYYTYYHTYYYY